MNKASAEIIAGIIPAKMARNRWRGILRYGLKKGASLMCRIKKDNSRPKYFLSVCAIVKNEGPYFVEWLEWYRRQGVEHFYIYDNESTDDTRRILDPYIKEGIVDYTFFPGNKKQLAAYDDCLDRYRFESRWIAIVDLDEFIFPVRDRDIPSFLSRFDNASVVEINWLCYGSGGQKEYTPGNVMDRFKFHSLPDARVNRHVKSIVNPRRVFSMIGAHEAARINGKAYDSHGDVITRNFRDREPQHDVIRINHYAVKSYGEFLAKRAKGRVRLKKDQTIGMDYFTRYDLNDIKDK